MPPSLAEQPGGRAPAPGALLVVQCFVNTLDIEGDAVDEFATVASMTRWLGDAGLPHTGLRAADRAAAARLREAVRDLVDVRDHPDRPATHDFGAAVTNLALAVEVVDGVPTMVGTTPIGRTLAPIVDAIRRSLDDGTWSRLKVCSRDRCRWLFYDHSKNNGSHWCAASICGMREKSRRAYHRHKTTTRPATP